MSSVEWLEAAPSERHRFSPGASKCDTGGHGFSRGFLSPTKGQTSTRIPSRISKEESSRKNAKMETNGIGKERADAPIAVHRRLDPETMETRSHKPIKGFAI